MKVGVVGAGQMGVQLALLFSSIAEVVFIVRDIDKADGILKKNYRLLNRSSSLVKMSLDRVVVKDEYEGLHGCNYIFEAVTEDRLIKGDVLKLISDAVCPNAIIATNTSTLSVTDLSQKVIEPGRFLGCHFFNPATLIPLVEVSSGEHTNERCKEQMVSLLSSLKFKYLFLDETPGFVVNRALFLMLNEAICMVDEKVSSVKEIDSAFKITLGHPMGPLSLCDFIGLDTCLSILTNLHNELGDQKYRPSKLLVKKVRANKLGKKTGEGFRVYRSKIVK